MPTASRWLSRYLQDHYGASRLELELFWRSASSQRDSAVRAELTSLAAEAAEDRAALLGIMDGLAVPRGAVQERLAVVAERLGRLKPNGTVLRRSPLSDLVELEALADAVSAKRLRWACLRELTAREPRLNPYQLDKLIRRADDQLARLERQRLNLAPRVLLPADAGTGS
jgi:hypothetical protein